MYGLVFEPNSGYIGYLHIQIQSSDLLIFGFYGRHLYPVKCIVEYGVSKSWSGDQGITH